MFSVLLWEVYSYYKTKLSSQEKIHYEGVMNNKVLPDIKVAETQYQELEHNRKVLSKASAEIGTINL